MRTDLLHCLLASGFGGRRVRRIDPRPCQDRKRSLKVKFESLLAETRQRVVGWSPKQKPKMHGSGGSKNDAIVFFEAQRDAPFTR